MRLINTSDLQIEEFFGDLIPPYAILSHTWGEEEVTLQDMQSGRAQERRGYAKIMQCCKRASADGFKYYWVDTCCIDKTSSAELSEAINSMYQWYRNASICYAYLSDVQLAPSMLEFQASRWFTRGWTLQELIAPAVVEFYSSDWSEIGTKLSLQAEISAVTGISQGVLWGGDPRNCTVATRMSWASRRTTTRVEDEAYCLMGIFGINFSLLYGEGRRAFLRLQEEIMRVEEDYTMLVSNPYPLVNINPLASWGLLAPSPSAFAFCEVVGYDLQAKSLRLDRLWKSPFTILSWVPGESSPPTMTSRGLQISLPVKKTKDAQKVVICLSVLKKTIGKAQEHLVCVTLRRTGAADRYIRSVGEPLRLVSYKESKTFHMQTIYIEQPRDQVVSVQQSSEIQAPFSQTRLLVTNIIEAKDQRYHVIVESSLPNVQQLNLAFHDGSCNIHSYRSLKEDAVLALVKLDADLLAEATLGQAKSTFLVDDSPAAKSIHFRVSGQPKASFQIVLYVHLKIPHFRALLENLQPAAALHTDDALRTDRLAFYMKFESDQTKHRFMVTFRKVCSPVDLATLQRFVLSVEHEEVPWHSVNEYNDAAEIVVVADGKGEER